MNLLPPQPSLIVSYLRVGRLLYWSLIIFLVESWFYWQKLMSVLLNNSHLFWVGFWFWCFLFSFLHIFLVLADGWSRFQNYKRAKDQFFLHGFHPRIADRYIVSKCQRMAAIEAAAAALTTAVAAAAALAAASGTEAAPVGLATEAATARAADF
jgi:hypothetical protein